MKNNVKNHFGSYSYSKPVTPFPESSSEKPKPPVSNNETAITSELFQAKAKTPEQAAIEYMSSYKKVERALVINFYTGGGGMYTRGILDSIYKGFNPLNPNM